MKKENILDLLKSKFNLDDKTASGLILSGRVLVNDKIITKTGIIIDHESEIRIKDIKEYVSRGAYKMLDAYESFSLDFNDKICLDAGSSTGGFTQVLLLKGAKKVYSVDCGINQLDFSLRKNPIVIVFEHKKIQDLKFSDLQDKIDIAVMDVSFTSSVFITDYIKKELKIDEFIILVKPQFEYDRLKKILNLTENFNGVVKNDEDRKKIIDHIMKEFENIGLKIANFKQCNIKGSKGNIEYLIHLRD